MILWGVIATSAKARCYIFLFLTSIVWGSGFVAQKFGTTVEPCTYNGLRFLLAAGCLAALLPLIDRWRGNKSPRPAGNRRQMFRGSLACGLMLALGANLQQFGLYFDTDAGKAGFITSLYIVFVPLLGLVIGQRVRLLIWGCVALGAAGFYLLTLAGSSGDLHLENGDFYLLLCAFVFAGHIMVIDRFSPLLDGVRLAAAQFFVAGLASLIAALATENIVWVNVVACREAIIYGGLASGGLGYTLQVLGQQHADPAIASLILSLEAVFAVIFGATIAGESLTLTEMIGCAVIFSACIIPQISESREK